MTTENQLLQEGVNEIKRLRRDNEIMSARLNMFDTMVLLFNTQPAYPSQGMGEDVAWKMEKQIAATSKES